MCIIWRWRHAENDCRKYRVQTTFERSEWALPWNPNAGSHLVAVWMRVSDWMTGMTRWLRVTTRFASRVTPRRWCPVASCQFWASFQKKLGKWWVANTMLKKEVQEQLAAAFFEAFVLALPHMAGGATNKASLLIFILYRRYWDQVLVRYCGVLGRC